MKRGEQKQDEEKALAQGFTPEAIDKLIEEAKSQASGVQGSIVPAGGASSHQSHFAAQGSKVSAGGAVSQEFHFQTVGSQPDPSSSPFELCVGDLGDVISDILVSTKSHAQCRSLPTIGKKDLFPLPVSRCLEFSPDFPKILQSIALSLNSLYGLDEEAKPGGSETSVRAMKRLAQQLKGMDLLKV